MKEVVIHAHCDGRELGTCDGPVGEVLINGRVLDLCTAHYHVLWEPVRVLVDAAPRVDGSTPAPGGAGTTGIECLACGKRYSSMGNHLSAAHDVAMVDVYGLTCPLCNKTFDSIQAMGVHVSRTTDVVHDGVGSVPDAFAEAERRGDPHGVERRRRDVVRATVRG